MSPCVSTLQTHIVWTLVAAACLLSFRMPGGCDVISYMSDIGFVLTCSQFSLINSEYEFVALHRDIGETELKQGREIRSGGNLVYVDSPAVRAVKHGRILILEGIEKAERGIMPVCCLPRPSC